MNSVNKKQIKSLIHLFRAIEMLADLGTSDAVIYSLNQIITQEVENVAKRMNLQYDDVIDLVNQYDI